MSHQKQANVAALEAVLFINGESLSLKMLEKILGIDAKTLNVLLEQYEKTLDEREGSLVLIRDAKSVRLGIKPEFNESLEDLAKSELQESLSKAALEVLAIVAYLAPVSRAQIDAIRGVNSHFTLRNLSLRGLIDRSGNPKDARGYIYEPSMNFLTTLGISNVGKLPNYEALRSDERLVRLHNRNTDTDLDLVESQE